MFRFQSKQPSVTQPKPFSFDARPRHQRRSQSVEPDEPCESGKRIIRAKPAPHFGVPVVMSNLTKRSTAPATFSFAGRDEEMAKKKHEKIEKILEQEKKEREFRANPMPDLHKPVALPLKNVLMPTDPKPFNHEVRRGK